MKILIDPTNRTYKVLAKVVDLYVLNMLFLLTSGFGLFIGPASVALYSCTYKEIQDTNVSRTKYYLREFRKNFFRGIVLELILGTLLSIVMISVQCARLLPGVLMIISLTSLVLFSMVGIIWGITIFPYTAHYENTVIRTFKVCFQVAMLNIKPIIYICAVVVFVWLIGTINSFFFTLVFIVIVLIGFSGLAYINSLVIYPIFQKYEK